MIVRTAATFYAIQTLGYGANGSPIDAAGHISGGYSYPHTPKLNEYARVYSPFEGLGQWQDGEQDTPGGGGGTDYTQNVDDTLGLSDALSFTRELVLADTLTLADAVAFQRGLSVSDTLALADAFSFTRGVVLADALALADAVAFQRGLSVSDTLALADSLVSANLGKEVNVNDSLSLSDGVSFGRGLGVVDTLALSDFVAFVRFLVFTDSLDLLDEALAEILGVHTVPVSIPRGANRAPGLGGTFLNGPRPYVTPKSSTGFAWPVRTVTGLTIYAVKQIVQEVPYERRVLDIDGNQWRILDSGLVEEI